MRHALAALVASACYDPEHVVWLAETTLKIQRYKSKSLRAEWEAERGRAAGLIERQRGGPARRAAAVLLPNAKRGDLMIRYESHLQKQLTTTLHELERLQALRLGRAVVPPAVVDVTVTGAGQ